MFVHASKSEQLDWEALNAEIETASDRAAAIVAAACVEESLESVLTVHFERNETLLREIFRSTGPLGSFSAKISMGYLMRIYPKIVLKELDTIKEIRNAFAHRVPTQTFSTQRVRDLANNLSLFERFEVYFATPKRPLSPSELKVGDRVEIIIGFRRVSKDHKGGVSALPELPSATVLTPRLRFTRSCGFHNALLLMIAGMGFRGPPKPIYPSLLDSP